MSSSRNQFKNNPLLKQLSSLKITVSCLLLLFILTFWGTIDQVQNGLYHSQEQFFHSFIFKAFGFLPFPGAQLVLWVLFFNLVCVAITRFVYSWSHIGILIIHFGLLTYFVAAFVTLHDVEESQLTLYEGESSNVSADYREWELSVWRQEQNKKQVVAFDAKNLKPGEAFAAPEYDFNVGVETYYPNAKAYTGNEGARQNILNSSGISALTAIDRNKEPEKNLPGGVFIIEPAQNPGAKTQKTATILLFGGEIKPTLLKLGGETYYFMLRHKRYKLPLVVKLIDFQMEKHPDTEIARSYKSKIEIQHDALSREVVIAMNDPLRYKNYTFYQASYSIDAAGRELSTLAVVKNSGRILPYVASLTTFVGLVTHFLLMAFKSRGRRKGEVR